MFDFLNQQQRSKNTISHDGIDHIIHEGILSKSQALRTLRQQGKEIIKTFPYLQEDVFFSLFKPWPELLVKANIAPECIFNHAEIEKLLDSPSYKELRQYTQLDEFGAGLGSKALLEELCSRLKEEKALQDTVQQINKAAEQQQKADDLRQQLDDLSDNPSSQRSSQIKQEIQQALQAAKDFSTTAEQLMAGTQSQLRRAMTTAAEKAAEECEETETVLSAWGFNEGEFQRLPFEKKVEIAKLLRNQKKFKDMTKLVGRMRNLAVASRQAKMDHMRVELHSITTGDDIAHALTQELVALKRPALKLNFYRKLYEKQLLQYDLTYRDKAGRGPIICLIDSSGSMSGSRDEWAKAVGLGILEVALKERRAFAYAVFGSKRDPLIKNIFTPGERSPDKVINMVTAFYGGGTNYEEPLRFAMETVRESSFDKADVVMITDGECKINDEFLKELLEAKKEKEFAVYSILIGHTPYELQRWSDQILTVHDLFDQSVPENLYQSI